MTAAGDPFHEAIARRVGPEELAQAVAIADRLKGELRTLAARLDDDLEPFVAPRHEVPRD